MNLKRKPTRKQLKELLRHYHDNWGPHIMWVSYTGHVYIERVPKGMSYWRFKDKHCDRLKFRMETWPARGYCVGKVASQNEYWVNRLFISLMDSWTKNFEGYCDAY